MNWAFSTRVAFLGLLWNASSPLSADVFCSGCARHVDLAVRAVEEDCARVKGVFGRGLSVSSFARAKQRGGIGSVLGFRDGFLRGAQWKGDVERNRVVDNEPLSSKKSSFFHLLSFSRYGFIYIYTRMQGERLETTTSSIVREIIGDFDWTASC